MELYLKTAAGVLLAVLLIMTVQNKNMAIAAAAAACFFLAVLGLEYLTPVVDFLRELENLGEISGEVAGILLKITGIGIVTQIVVPICADSGNQAMGKALQTAATALTLYPCLPFFRQFLSLLTEVLGKV